MRYKINHAKFRAQKEKQLATQTRFWAYWPFFSIYFSLQLGKFFLKLIFSYNTPLKIFL